MRPIKTLPRRVELSEAVEKDCGMWIPIQAGSPTLNIASGRPICSMAPGSQCFSSRPFRLGLALDELVPEILLNVDVEQHHRADTVELGLPVGAELGGDRWFLVHRRDDDGGAEAGRNVPGLGPITDVVKLPEIPWQRPGVIRVGANLDHHVVMRGMDGGDLVDAFDEVQQVRAGVRINAGIARVGAKSAVGAARLAAELPRRRRDQRADQPFRPARPGCFDQRHRADTGEQDHAVQECEHEPRRLVADDRIDHRQRQGVNGEEPQ